MEQLGWGSRMSSGVEWLLRVSTESGLDVKDVIKELKEKGVSKVSEVCKTLRAPNTQQLKDIEAFVNNEKG